MKITTNKQYKESLHKVYKLMNKGSKNLTDAEAAQIAMLSTSIEHYEDTVMKLMPVSVTINTIVQQKINEMNITQTKLAEMFGMGTAKISQILNGKREPDVPFLKAVHEKLGIDGNFILETV